MPKGNLFVGTGLIIFVLGYRAVFSLAGCFLTARLAPNNHMRHALILGVIGVVFCTLGALANAKLQLGPAWYGWTLVAITIPIAGMGGKLAIKKSKITI